MRKTILITGSFCLLLIVQLSFRQADAPLHQAQEYFRSSAEAFYNATLQLEKSVETDACDTASPAILKALQASRTAYKQVEVLTEYYATATAEMLNGPLIRSADEEEGTQQVFDPEGLQVIEEIVFSGEACEKKADLVREMKRIKGAASRLRQMAAAQQMTDWQLFDAMQQELVRIAALGISGFDATYSKASIPESAQALEGVRHIFSLYRDGEKKKLSGTYSLLGKAISYLAAHPGFDSFDRVIFIREYLNPLYTGMRDARQQLGITPFPVPSAIRAGAATIFDQDAFDPYFYSPAYRAEGNVREMEQLGRMLFFDPVLSGNGERSCASCHHPEKAFTDGLQKSTAFGGADQVFRNAPTLINVAFQNSYFWDSRVAYLEDQVEVVTRNAVELHGNFEQAAALLQLSEEYVTLFRDAFAPGTDTAITGQSIRKAIAAYERSLLSFNSRFDRHMRREGDLLSNDEIKGFNLFMGKAGCGTCHFLPLFNGTVPPLYVKTEWENLGVPSGTDTAGAMIDADQGRYLAKSIEHHTFAFKTPTVRNVSHTAPFMHNGVYHTLEEVMDFYNRGGGAGLNIVLPNQTLPGEALQLTEKEKQQVIAFMGSLTDFDGLTGAPARLPEIPQEKMRYRKVGGSY